MFAMIVLEKKLSKVYEQIDMVATPSGFPAAMVHCNNCTSDINAWGKLFREFAKCIGVDMKMGAVYDLLFDKALEGEKDGGGLLAYNYLSGEHITGLKEGRPLFVRMPESELTLANFMRTHLFTSLGALKTGMDILFKKEKVQVDSILGHGGFFKSKTAGTKIMAAAMNTPISVMETAGEGGAWGIALLASYMKNKENGESLEAFLSEKVFAGFAGNQTKPDKEDAEGFEVFMKRYLAGLEIEKKAAEVMNL